MRQKRIQVMQPTPVLQHLLGTWHRWLFVKLDLISSSWSVNSWEFHADKSLLALTAYIAKELEFVLHCSLARGGTSACKWARAPCKNSLNTKNKCVSFPVPDVKIPKNTNLRLIVPPECFLKKEKVTPECCPKIRLLLCAVKSWKYWILGQQTSLFCRLEKLAEMLHFKYLKFKPCSLYIWHSHITNFISNRWRMVTKIYHYGHENHLGSLQQLEASRPLRTITAQIINVQFIVH
jgi:hypothetical protein